MRVSIHKRVRFSKQGENLRLYGQIQERYLRETPINIGCDMDRYRFGVATPETFQKPVHMALAPAIPEAKPYRIFDLQSFGIFGVDFKIFNDRVYIIELNGIRSGVKGFRLAKSPFLGSQPFHRAPVRHIWRSEKEPEYKLAASRFLHNENYVEFILQDSPYVEDLGFHLFEMAGPTVAYWGAELLRQNRRSEWFAGVASLVYLKNLDGKFDFSRLDAIHPSWKKTFFPYLDHLIQLSSLCGDKLLVDQCFRDHRQIKTPTYPFTQEGWEQCMDEQKPKFVIVKPRKGCVGRRVRIYKTKKVDPRTLEYSTREIVENYVPSKPIFSSWDGQRHDACGRYMIIVEENKDGSISVHHFGGYWRLAPDMFSKRMGLDSVRANLGQGALAEPLHRQESGLVRQTLDEHFPGIYRELVNALSRHPKLPWYPKGPAAA